jgi:hypothetical protein
MAITFGSTAAPSNITTYLDSLFAQSLANYKKQLIDNIGAANAFLYDLIKSDMYESADGGTYLAENLMYALAPADSYSGYDEFGTNPIDGITQAIYQWSQMACPISYSMKEVIQNEHRLENLVKSRIQQSEMGIQEGWAQAFMWGAATTGGNIYTARTSPLNGSLGVTPLPLLVSYYPTGGWPVVGNIDPSVSTNAFWRNQYATSAATTYSGFLYEMENMFNTCGLATGGKPTHILLDQISYQNWIHAYFTVYKSAAPDGSQEYPFIMKMWQGAKVIMDDKVPDAYSNTAPTEVAGISSGNTYGTAYFLNQKFFRIRYHPERDWEMLKDENGKTFAKPINGDSRTGAIAWMGNSTINNRRKHGVLAKITGRPSGYAS